MDYKKDANGNIIKVIKTKSKTVKVVNPINNKPKQNLVTKDIKITPNKKEEDEKIPEIDISNERRNPLQRYQSIGKISPIYKNEVIYLIGGGPSLKKLDFKLLNGRIKIAINKAFLFVKDAQILYWTDFRFYKWYEKEINEFKGLKITNKNKPVRNDIINLRDTGRSGLEIDPSSIRHGNNSGFAAINLAVHFGAKKIVLLGYDMHSEGTNTHWHDGYTKINHNPKIYKKSMIPFFGTLVEPLKELGVQVWNANPDSALETFPKCSLAEAINMR